MQFLNNLVWLVEDSSLDFWDVVGMSDEGRMPNFLGDWKNIKSGERGEMVWRQLNKRTDERIIEI